MSLPPAVADLDAATLRNLVREAVNSGSWHWNQSGLGASPGIVTVAAGSALGGPNGGQAFVRTTVTVANTPATGTDVMTFYLNNYGVSTLGMTIPTEVGQPYSMVVPVRSNRPQAIRVQAQGITATSGGTQKAGPNTTLVPDRWTWVPVEGWIPLAGTVGLRVDVDTASAGVIAWAIGDTFDVGRPAVYQRATLPPGVPGLDGATPGWTWLGTPFASESVGPAYRLEGIAGAPILSRSTVGSTSLDLGPTDARSVYAVSQRLVLTTSGGASTAVARGIRGGGDSTVTFDIRQSASGGMLEVRPQFLNGGGASGVYSTQATLDAARTSLGMHALAAIFPAGLATLNVSQDGSAFGTRPGMTVGDGYLGHGGVQLIAASANESPLWVGMWAAEHSLDTAKRIQAWLARYYGGVVPVPAGF